MRLRPWHLIVGILIVSASLIGVSTQCEDRTREVVLGLGLNLLSSIVFFILLELYWQKVKMANGKEVNGFDYRKFARNVAGSKHVRVLGTFIYPFTNHPNHTAEKHPLLDALLHAVAQPDFTGAQLLFLNPSCGAAKSRAAERKDDDVLLRMEECLETLHWLSSRLDNTPGGQRLEVRLFSRVPALSLFQTDNFGSMSFYFRDRPISEVVRYEFFLDSPIGVFVEKTFDDLWRDERTVTLTDYLSTRSPRMAESNHAVTV